MEAIKGMSIWAVWFSFRGRIDRGTYWVKGLLIPIGIASWLIMVGGLGAYLLGPDSDLFTFAVLIVWGSLAIILPVALAAASVKRLHDRNRYGWWILAIFIPVVGMVWLFIELGFLKGDAESNRYGDVPSNV